LGKNQIKEIYSDKTKKNEKERGLEEDFCKGLGECTVDKTDLRVIQGENL